MTVMRVMRLWVVEDRARWGFSLNVVRAATEEEAVWLVCGDSSRDGLGMRKPKVQPLEVDGNAGIVWCYDESPDTPGERD